MVPTYAISKSSTWLTLCLGELHLHPISETHQFRPTLTYLDVFSRKNRRSRANADDSDSDDGPPPDPDEAPPVVAAKKEKKAATDAKEIQVTARKTDDKGGLQAQGGLSTARREMLAIIRAEEDEDWVDLEYHDTNVGAPSTCRNQNPETQHRLRRLRILLNRCFHKVRKNLYALQMLPLS